MRPTDVTVTSASGSEVVVNGPSGFDQTLTRGSSEYSGVAEFDIEDSGEYTVSVATPGTQVIVAPSIVSGFRASLGWIALVGMSALLMLVGVTLLIIGLVRGSRSPAVASPAQAAGWYPDPQRQAAWRWYDGTRWTDRTG